ncbi:MAG TPA: hypothetical protein VHS09_17680 [Polyangiaceae bacterium]|jgi:hypothetical protein|nr:hypothetical protein [Polyangiaceae bacterium]
MRRRTAFALVLAAVVLPTSAAADSVTPPAAPCASPGSLECPSYERYVNHKYGFSVDLPTFFVKTEGDADGRGQPFEYGSRARVRAWAMFDNPPMTVQQLYGDWTRRDGITFKTLAVNTWVVRGRDGGRLYYTRSILADGIISTLEIAYDRDLADVFEPILARSGASLMTLPGEGIRGKAH